MLPRPVEPELITVGTDEVVVTGESAPDARLTTRVGDHEVTTEGPHHVARLTGLDPDTEYALEVEGVDPHPYLPESVRTLARPTGRLLATVATANDVHFGELVCGVTGDPAQDAKGPIFEAEPGDPPYPTVMNGAVIDEMRALGPDAVVVKGDLTAYGSAEEYGEFLAAYGALGDVMHHVRGNHDAIVDPTMALEDAPYAVDLDGVTLAVLDTVVPGSENGSLRADSVQWLEDLAADRSGPVLVFGHHPCFNVEHGIRSDKPYFGIQADDSDVLVDVVHPSREPGRVLRRSHPPEPGAALRPRPPCAVRRGRLHEGLPGRVGRVPRVRGRLHPGRAEGDGARRVRVGREDPSHVRGRLPRLRPRPPRAPLLHGDFLTSK